MSSCSCMGSSGAATRPSNTGVNWVRRVPRAVHHFIVVFLPRIADILISTSKQVRGPYTNSQDVRNLVHGCSAGEATILGSGISKQVGLLMGGMGVDSDERRLWVGRRDGWCWREEAALIAPR